MAQRDNSIDFGSIDLDRHDLPALRADIGSILDVQAAIIQVLRWTVLLSGAGAIIAWLVFRAQMPTWVLVPYVIVVSATLALAAGAIGVAAILRSRVVATNAAADRVVTTVAALHGDYLRIRTGEVGVPTGELAQLLATELVFPALIGASNQALGAATMASGPTGRALRWLSRPFIGTVERRVLEALSQVFDSEAEPWLVAPAEPDHPPVPSPDADPSEQIDLATVLSTAGLPPEVSRWYEAVHRYLERMIGLADAVTSGSTLTLVILASLPAAGVLAAGWMLS